MEGIVSKNYSSLKSITRALNGGLYENQKLGATDFDQICYTVENPSLLTYQVHLHYASVFKKYHFSLRHRMQIQMKGK